MIRVLLRHIDDAEGFLIGDFAPSEIDDLVHRLRSTRIYYVADEAEATQSEDAKVATLADDGGPLQWILTSEARPRVALEIVIED